MSSHPEQLKIQIEDALSSAIPYEQVPDTIDLELETLLPGKNSSHFIAVFYSNGEPEKIWEILDEARDDMMDEVASAITRRRIPNITFKLTPTRLSSD